jgi:predicted nucleotidyltransferase
VADPIDLACIREVATALGDLAKDVVFVGGAVTSLLLTDAAAPPTRHSLDIDLVVRASGLVDYYALEAKLRARGFRPATEPDAPRCRWRLGALVVDAMPDDASILGFTNRWYSHVLETADEVQIDGVAIKLATAPCFLATKLEAFAGRGNGDYQASRDMEDIVALVDGRSELAAELDEAAPALRAYVRETIAAMRGTDDLAVAVIGHLAGDIERAAIVLDRFAELARP